MIKDSQRTFNQIHILVDALLIAGTYLLFKALPLERSILSFLIKGCLCFVIVMGVNIALFCKTEEFAYLLSKVKSMVKRK